MKKIILIGSGIVGRTIAEDLSVKYDVTAVDVSNENLNGIKSDRIKKVQLDFKDKDSFSELVRSCDLVIGALPGYLGYELLKSVISLGRNIVDISFCKEDVLQLNGDAIKNNVTAVVDCGIAPGLSNMVAGYYNSRMKVESFKCYVGGLPFVREQPFEYKAPFSLSDVLEEYVRPARMIENGKLVVKPALSEVEEIEFDGIGILEAFNTDGLRTLLQTLKIPNMSEKTLRYPGYAAKIKILKETGFLSDEEVEVDGVKIKPISLTEKLLSSKWRLYDGEEEFTVMRIIIEGVKDNRKIKNMVDVYDRYDNLTKALSMARLTGFICAAVASLLCDGLKVSKGIVSPEYLGEDENVYDYVIGYLRDRGIKIDIK